MKRLRTASAKPVVLSPVFPNVGVQVWFQLTLDALIAQSTAELQTTIATAWAKTPPLFKNSHITAGYGDAALFHAAGVIYRSGDSVLLVHRTDGEGWAFPGGGLEPNETPEAAARREAFEETLHPCNGPLEFLCTQDARGVRFATFLADVLEPFAPTLNSEHDDFQWETVEAALKYKLHPGAHQALKRLRVPVLAQDVAPDQKRDSHGRWTTTGMSEALEDQVERESSNPNEGPADQNERLLWALKRIIDAPKDDERVKAKHRKEAARVLRQLSESVLAQDAPSPTKALQIALQKWGTQTIKRFDLMSRKISDDFAARNQRATQAAMMAQFKKAGFTVKFKATRESLEAYRLVAAENVALIKSIPRKMHEAVEQKVWNAVRNGSDLHKLSTQLRKVHGSTVKRAALIARDQNAKAKAVIERVRQQELGIRYGIWMHSHAGKEPRPTHVAMNGKRYALSKGMWDSDEGEWVHPGQLINCRCTMRPVIEGFED